MLVLVLVLMLMLVLVLVWATLVMLAMLAMVAMMVVPRHRLPRHLRPQLLWCVRPQLLMVLLLLVALSPLST